MQRLTEADDHVDAHTMPSGSATSTGSTPPDSSSLTPRRGSSPAPDLYEPMTPPRMEPPRRAMTPRHDPSANRSQKEMAESPRSVPHGRERRNSDQGTERQRSGRFSMFQLGSMAEKEKLQELRRLELGNTAERVETPKRVCAHEWLWDDKQPSRLQISLALKCPSVQLSIVDDQPCELLYVTLSKLSVHVTEGTNDDERPDGAVSGTTLRYQQQLRLELGAIQVPRRGGRDPTGRAWNPCL